MSVSHDDRKDMTAGNSCGEERDARDESFYFTDVVFNIEGTLVKVPRRPFYDSGIFSDMFSLPVSINVVVEGESDSYPIRLESVSKNDFRSLLKLLFPSHHPEDAMSLDDWTAALRLASMWEFDHVRRVAIEHVSNASLPPVDKIVLARDCGIPQWLIPAFNELVQKDRHLTTDEASRLGWDWVLKLGRVREACVAGLGAGGDSPRKNRAFGSPGNRRSRGGAAGFESRWNQEERNRKGGADYSNQIRGVFGFA